jgi:hypothetical protein
MLETDLKSKFGKVYANLPLAAREEIIVVIDNEPMTWNAAWLEIESDTPKSKKILELLVRMQILKTNE